MERNLAVAFTSPGRVEVIERAVPCPGPGQALIRTTHSLISAGTELTLLSGEGWSPLGRSTSVLPQVGYSSVGVVVDVGEGGDRAWIGRRVGARAPHASYSTCTIEPAEGEWRSGLFEIPRAVSSEDATLLALGLTAMNALRRSRLTWGESVAVAGLGLLGQLIARLAVIAGAVPVVGVSRGEDRLRALPRRAGVVGLRHDFSGGAGEVLGANQGRAFDVVFEVTGDGGALPAELELVRRGGRLVVVGSPRGASKLDLHVAIEEPSRAIIGAQIASLPMRSDADTPGVARYADLFFRYLTDGAMSVSELITHRRYAASAADAYRLLVERTEPVLGVLLEWEGLA